MQPDNSYSINLLAPEELANREEVPSDDQNNCGEFQHYSINKLDKNIIMTTGSDEAFF